MEQNKEFLIRILKEKKIKGKSPDVTGRNIRHDGRVIY